ncbi:hypothetical protein IGJ83_003186 [Enterococcus pernyi]
MTEKKMSLIDRCKQMDIVDFARNNGLAVVNKGRDYRLEDHDSFVFDRKKQRFYWNSQGIGGDIIKLTQLFFIDDSIQNPKQRFKAALDYILKDESKVERVENLHFETQEYKHHPMDYQPLTEKGRTYLKEQRKFPEWLIEYGDQQGLILEMKPRSERKNYIVKDDRLDYAIVFPWKDRHADQVLGATYQGTIIDYERFGDRGTYKHIDINPTPNHGFNVLLGSPKNLKFFESPIDLLSYAALNRETVKDTWLISMDGLKDAVVGHYVREAVTELAPKEEFPESIEICVDNDRAGHIFWDKVHRLGVSNPFTGKAVYFEPDLPNDWQVPKKYQTIYEEVGKEMNVAPEAIMAIHKIENNLTENNQIVSFGEIHGVFAKKLAPKEKVQIIDVKEKCIEAAQQLKSCEKSDGTYDFDRFYRGKGKINEEIQISLKAKHYFEGYKNHDHEFVSEVKKDWNDQWKHEIQQQEIRKQKRAMLFQQSRQQERE